MKTTPKADVVPLQDNLPPVNIRVIVVCKESRCLGYLDRDGSWRDDAHDNEIRDITGWMEI